MKNKLLTLSTAALIGLSSTSSYGFALIGDLLPTLTGASMNIGAGVIDHPVHLFPACIANEKGPLCTNLDDILYHTMWIDGVLAGITVVDAGVSFLFGERTIDASDAIKNLEEALKGKGGNCSGGKDTSGDSSMAIYYTPEMIQAQIEIKNAPADKMFENTREAIKEYLFETPSPDIKGDCGQSDKDCAVARQNEWLLASVTLASATSDKVLDQTAKKNVKDGKTQAEKAEEEQAEGDSQTTGGGKTTLKDHFEELASSFNSAKSPMDLYTQMANIVLDTHRQVNDANALFGRDLEAQGLRVVTETGPVSLSEAEETEE